MPESRRERGFSAWHGWLGNPAARWKSLSCAKSQVALSVFLSRRVGRSRKDSTAAINNITGTRINHVTFVVVPSIDIPRNRDEVSLEAFPA